MTSQQDSASGQHKKSINDVVKEEVDSLPAETDESQAISELEVASLQRDKLKIENQQLQEAVEDRKADRKLREKYANAAFRFLTVFAVFCGLVLIAQGSPSCPFKLDHQVVITLIGATAASVIGLVGWVARGLFRAPR